MNSWPNLIFDIFDGSRPAKIWNFGQISFLPFLTGPDLQKCEFLAKFNFWHFQQVRSCKNVNFWPNLIFDIFDRSGPAKCEFIANFHFWHFDRSGPAKCEFIANFHFWHFDRSGPAKMWNFIQLPFWTFLTGPDLQNVSFWSILFFDILTGPDLGKCEILSKFNFWHSWQVQTCKYGNFWPNLIFDVFDRSGPAKMWIFGQI